MSAANGTGRPDPAVSNAELSPGGATAGHPEWL